MDRIAGVSGGGGAESLDLSLVLACYNEEPLLVQSVKDIVAVLETSRLSYEIIFVDDASRDRTRSLIDMILKEYEGRTTMRALFHDRNIGRGGAVRDGFLAAQGEIVGYLDVDLEIQASAIIACVLALRRGYDVAVAKRLYAFTWRSVDRHLLSKGYAWLVRRILGIRELTDTESGCKFFRRDTLGPVLQQCEHVGWFWDTEIMVRCHAAGLRMTEVPLLYLRRFDKPSSVRPWKDTMDYVVQLLRFRTKMAQAHTKEPVSS